MCLVASSTFDGGAAVCGGVSSTKGKAASKPKTWSRCANGHFITMALEWMTVMWMDLDWIGESQFYPLYSIFVQYTSFWLGGVCGLTWVVVLFCRRLFIETTKFVFWHTTNPFILGQLCMMPFNKCAQCRKNGVIKPKERIRISPCKRGRRRKRSSKQRDSNIRERALFGRIRTK